MEANYLNKLWKRINESVEKKLSPENLAKWKKTIEVEIIDINEKNGSITLLPSDVFVHVLLKSQSFFIPLKDSIKEITGTELEIILENSEGTSENDKIIIKKYDYYSGIQGKMRFDNYVVSPNNKLLLKACVTVSESFNGNWSPLFIYGKSGVGKTHLLQSIGHNSLKNNSNIKVKYINAYDFMGVVQRIGTEKNTAREYEKLKEDFYSYDVLLIDDIQTLSGKDKSKEIMFNIFRHFGDNNKQIVAASDVEPENLKGFERRFITRFKGNLTIKVSPPDVLTSKKILEEKIKNDTTINSGDIDIEVIEFIAQNFSTDVRSLEGALSSLTFWAINNDKSRISSEDIPLIFSHLKKTKAVLTIEAVIKAVTNYYNLKVDDIASTKRNKKIAQARHIAIYLSRKLLNATYNDIGKKIGGRDHSTIMTSYKKVEVLLSNDESTVAAIDSIKESINA